MHQRALLARDARVGDRDGDAAADRGGRVRHGAHERRAPAAQLPGIASVRPAMIDTTTVAAPTNGASAGMTSGATCGLTATITAATSPIRSRGGLRRTPRVGQRGQLRGGLPAR